MSQVVKFFAQDAKSYLIVEISIFKRFFRKLVNLTGRDNRAFSSHLNKFFWHLKINPNSAFGHINQMHSEFLCKRRNLPKDQENK